MQNPSKYVQTLGSIENLDQLIKYLELSSEEKATLKSLSLGYMVRAEPACSSLTEFLRHETLRNKCLTNKPLQFLKSQIGIQLDDQTLECMFRLSKFAQNFMTIHDDICLYLRANDISISLISVIATEETELNDYFLSVENLSDLAILISFIQESLQPSKQHLDSTEEVLHKIGELLSIPKSIRPYDQLFKEIANEEMRKNIIAMFTAKAHIYKNSPILFSILYNSRYCFRLISGEYTLVYKHLTTVNQNV